MVHAFKFKGFHLVLDVESGALHSVDEMTYDIVRAIETSKDPHTLPYSASDIDEVLFELSELKNAGAFDSKGVSVNSGEFGKGVIKSLCLHIAHDCNLRCKYCFADTGEFHGSRSLMSEEVGRKALEFLMEHSGNRRHLEVDFFGGEPLMNFPVVKALTAYGRELEKKYNKEIAFTLTTNMVAMDDEMMEFINREIYNVVISLDGRREIHDALRPTVNGKGSYDLIVHKAKKLIEGRKGGEYYVRGTFTANNLDFTNDVKALRDLGFDQISMEPVVLPDTSPYAILEEHVAAVLSEYDNLADYLLESRKNGCWFNFFHFMIDFEGGPCLKKRISGCGAGVEYAAITPEGDIYPCHQFVGEKQFIMGNVLTGEFDTSLQKEFLNCNVTTKKLCNSCWAKYFCSGGCAANAFKYNGSIYEPYIRSCSMLKRRTEIACGIFAAEKSLEESNDIT